MPSSVDFLGIDLTASSKKPSACVGLDKRLDVVFDGLLCSNSEVLGLAETYHPCVIAIDAPLALPVGLCCLEESCGCRPTCSLKGRHCERSLAGLGIPCYFTTKKSIIKAMAYRGIELRTALEARGHQVIEVYPHASKLRLWSGPIPSKSKQEGMRFLREHLVALLPG
jgi:predicted nuclease with RNAse H fold